MNDKRIRVIDAARGTAMFFVCLSHFAEVYFKPNANTRLLQWSYLVSMIASPTFIIISGLMLGYLYATHKEDFGRIRARYLTRGLFLLTIGHALILVAHIALAAGIQGALRWGFITDTIGASLIVGSYIVGKVTSKQLVMIGFSLYAISTAVTLSWHPESLVLQFLKDAFFGEQYGKGFHTEFFAFLPWFGLYLAGTWIGKQLARYKMQNDEDGIRRFVLRVAIVSLAAAFGIIALHKVLEYNQILPSGTSWLDELMSPTQKRPPSPIYFCFYGGLGLLIMFIMFKYESNSRLLSMYMKVASISGRTSIFMFILQYYVYFTFFVVANFRYSVLWPVYFLASVAFIILVSHFWDRANYNRFLWIPFSPLVRRLHPLLEHMFRH